MPKALERKLKRRAIGKGLTGDRQDAYVYGTLRKTGWRPSRERRSDDTRSGGGASSGPRRRRIGQ